MKCGKLNGLEIKRTMLWASVSIVLVIVSTKTFARKLKGVRKMILIEEAWKANQ